jgi:ubiquinone/menaquinone biosynthesis C-methylase UbiE
MAASQPTSGDERTGMSTPHSSTAGEWGSSYRLVAAEKWKAKSALLGSEVTKALVEYARPVAGMKVIDLACGTGEPGISLAERVGPGGSVTAVDQSADLLEIAAQRARNKKLENFTTRQADAHALPFVDASFDLATCRFGVMFFADPRRALGQLRRVLRPGARACFAAWGPIEQPYWQTTMGLVHKHVGGEMVKSEAASPFRFAAAGSLSEVLQDAGFQAVEESIRNLPWTWFGEPEEVFEYACGCATPFRPMLERVPEAMWPSIRAEAVAAMEKYRVGDEIRFGANVVFASGRA